MNKRILLLTKTKESRVTLVTDGTPPASLTTTMAVPAEIVPRYGVHASAAKSQGQVTSYCTSGRIFFPRIERMWGAQRGVFATTAMHPPCHLGGWGPLRCTREVRPRQRPPVVVPVVMWEAWIRRGGWLYVLNSHKSMITWKEDEFICKIPPRKEWTLALQAQM